MGYKSQCFKKDLQKRKNIFIKNSTLGRNAFFIFTKKKAYDIMFVELNKTGCLL